MLVSALLVLSSCIHAVSPRSCRERTPRKRSVSRRRRHRCRARAHAAAFQRRRGTASPLGAGERPRGPKRSSLALITGLSCSRRRGLGAIARAKRKKKTIDFAKSASLVTMTHEAHGQSLSAEKSTAKLA